MKEAETEAETEALRARKSAKVRLGILELEI